MKKRDDQARARAKVWWKTYRTRMNAGLEWCRRCGAREDLTFDHVTPRSQGGRLTLENATILCSTCNVWKDNRPWSGKSLAQEEARASPETRWADIARAEHAAYGEVVLREHAAETRLLTVDAVALKESG